MFVCTFLAVAATLSFHDLQNAEGRTDQSVISSGVSMTRNIDQRKSDNQIRIAAILSNEEILTDREKYDELPGNNVFHDDDDDLDKLSTKVNIDQDELPLLSRIRILLTEKRDHIFPLFLKVLGLLLKKEA